MTDDDQSRTIWARISAALTALRRGQPLSEVFDQLRGKPERSVGFTIAVIALGAKMAKADGQVTRDEVAAFREVFRISDSESDNAARVYNLARQDVAGYDEYARRIRQMFASDPAPLTNILEGLFHIARSDGNYHPAEDAFLHDVARIFGIDDASFRRIRSQYIDGVPSDPYDVLGVSPDADYATLRQAYRDAVRACHPDRLAAAGVPQEAVKLGERRLQALNEAWSEINAMRESA